MILKILSIFTISISPATINEISQDAMQLHYITGECPDDRYYQNATDLDKVDQFIVSGGCLVPWVGGS